MAAKTVTLEGAKDIYRSFGKNPTQLAVYHGIPIEIARRVAGIVLAGENPEIDSALFHAHILAYGGIRSGKTFAAAFRVWMASLRYPGNKIVVVRKRKEQLRNTFLDEFEKVGRLISGGHLDWIGELRPERDGALEYEVFTGHKDFPSKVIFAIEPDGDDKEVIERWKGYTISGVVCEEASQLKKVTPVTLFSRRSLFKTEAGAIPPRFQIDISNPVERGHWLQEVKQENLRLQLTGETPGILVIESKPEDNVHNLAPGYIEEQKEALKNDPIKYRMWIEGKDGVDVQGKPVYGAQFNPILHERADLKVNPFLPLIRGWDFGYHRPACTFLQEAQNGCINVLYEMLGQDETAEQFADRVLAFTQEKFPNVPSITDYGDPAGAQQTDKGDTTLQILRKKGIRVNYRPTGIDAGIRHIRNMLTRLRGTPARPELAFSPACQDLITGFSYGYHFPERGGHIAPKPMKDGYYEHLMDALRYALVNIRALPFLEESDVPGAPKQAFIAKGDDSVDLG